MRRPRAWVGLAMLAALTLASAAQAAAPIETVKFPSGDAKTTLVGYLFRPDGAGAHAAIVLLHGRAGPYSSQARGVYSVTTLSGRHLSWGRFWQEHGYVVLLVDSFGPRGYGAGFSRGSYAQRPAEVSEQTVRPLDAYGALAYLRSRPDVIADRVGLLGWSNGAMTALVTISDRAPGVARPTPEKGFRAAVALYPGCSMEHVRTRFVPYAPVLLLIAAVDEEVSPAACRKLATRSRAAGAPVEIVVYDGAQHNFDDPGRTKEAAEANRRATADARVRAVALFATALTPAR